MEKIQVIDISPFTKPDKYDDESRGQVLKAWNASFRTLGFAIVVGHGVPFETMANMQSDAREFFTQSKEEKLKSHLNLGYGKGGYVPMGIESVARSREESNPKPPDIVESLCFPEGGKGNDVIPEYPKTFKSTLDNYCKHLKHLLALSMEISAMSLGLPREYFATYFTEPECAIRLAYYPPQDKIKPTQNQMRYGAHTDYTGFTFLRPDVEVGGLEIMDPQTSTWIPVHPTEDCFIVNAGDLIQQWTNDHWISNLHRVVNPPKDLIHKSRLSVICFTGPNTDSVISPLEVCCGVDKPPKYAPVTACDHLKKKLEASNVHKS